MDSVWYCGPADVLIKKAKDMSLSLGELEARTDALLIDAEGVDQDLVNCRKFREEQLLKYLTENNTDEEQMQMLRDNAELKETASEFHQGIALISEKYRQHSENEMFINSYQLRDRYLEGLTQVVKEQDARIEQMLEFMKLTADLEDRSSDDNQNIIRKLAGENEQMRRQLQISSGEQLFRQGALESSESSTQFESNDPGTSKTKSFASLESFLSCLSQEIVDDDDCSSTNSLVSQFEVNLFIEEALTENPEEASPIQMNQE